MIATAARLLLTSARPLAASGCAATWASTLARGGSSSRSSSSFHASRSASSASASTTTTTTPPHKPHLHVQLEPLAGKHDGIFCLSLTRPEAKNAIGERRERRGREVGACVLCPLPVHFSLNPLSLSLMCARAPSHNFTGRQLLRELQEAIAALRSETTTRAVIVRSAVPGAFCAGADLRERAAMTPREAAAFVADLGSTFSSLASLPMPTIAAIDGVALGGGAELALACDLRVVGPGGALAFPEARLGIIPGAGGCARLPRLVGPARALDLIATCRRVGAEEAVEMGLAEYAATAGDAAGATGHAGSHGAADARALALAAAIAAAAPLSLRAAKAAVVGGAGLDAAGALALEAACYGRLLGSWDRLEGLAAFAQKRAPAWRGE